MTRPTTLLRPPPLRHLGQPTGIITTWTTTPAITSDWGRPRLMIPQNLLPVLAPYQSTYTHLSTRTILRWRERRRRSIEGWILCIIIATTSSSAGNRGGMLEPAPSWIRTACRPTWCDARGHHLSGSGEYDVTCQIILLYITWRFTGVRPTNRMFFTYTWIIYERVLKVYSCCFFFPQFTFVPNQQQYIFYQTHLCRTEN